MKTTFAIATASLCLVTGMLSAQTPSYAVASIHKSDPNEINIRISEGPQGGIRTTNTSVVKLISYAYNVDDFRIVGAPAWASSERFDVTFTPDTAEVTPDSEAGTQQVSGFFDRNSQRMQAVLRDRFGLVFHVESREQSIYRLIEAKGGNKLVRNKNEKKRSSTSINDNRQFHATAATMDMLAELLSMQLRRPVRNETHIEGEYDFTVNWTPDPELPEGPVISAIASKLGLRIESAKGPVPVYVIDKVDHPSEN